MSDYLAQLPRGAPKTGAHLAPGGRQVGDGAPKANAHLAPGGRQVAPKTVVFRGPQCSSPFSFARDALIPISFLKGIFLIPSNCFYSGPANENSIFAPQVSPGALLCGHRVLWTLRLANISFAKVLESQSWLQQNSKAF